MPRFVLSTAILAASAAALSAADWPQWMGETRDSVWAEKGIRQDFKKGMPKELWRVAIGGGYAGPAVAGGLVYVADKKLRAGAIDPKDPFYRARIPCVERLLCLDARTGKQVWEYAHDLTYSIQYPCGPRCTPLVHQGKVYALGAMGDLLCLDALHHESGKGKVLWSKNFVKEYGEKAPADLKPGEKDGLRMPQWGFAGHPIIYKDLLICVVGGDGTGLVAFDKETGKERWRAISAIDPGYNSPALIEAGGVSQLVAWTPTHLYGLNPLNGEKYWSVKLEPRHGMSIMTPRREGEFLFVAGIGNVGVTLQLDPNNPRLVHEVWRAKGEADPKTGIFPVNMTPFIENGLVYGADQPGIFRCADLKTGTRYWESFKPIYGAKEPTSRMPCGTTFVVKNSQNGLFYLFSETGDLVIGKLSRQGYQERGRMHLLEPTGTALNGRKAVWSHPAFANKCVFARNDKEIICVPLGE